MRKAPTLRSSAQARLLLYRLISLRITHFEQRLLNTDLSTSQTLLESIENSLGSDADTTATKEVLIQAFNYIDRSTKEGLQQQITNLTGQSVWLGVCPVGLLDSFIVEHLKLIKGIQREHLDKIGLVIQRGIRQGRLHKDIAKDIRQVTDISKRRARLIARNAPLQYSGELTKHHQLSSGIKKYRWQTSGDERVRNTHKARNNIVYSWDGPGPHPRSESQCRCDAIPVLE